MEYLVSFLEGIITFISPCLLPMLPIYVSYFLGGGSGGIRGETTSGTRTTESRRALLNALGFVVGFTVVFLLLGIFAASIGHFLRQYQVAVNMITGLVVIVFGLNFMGVLKIGFLNRTQKLDYQPKNLRFFSSALFGMVFSIGWTPCVGAFLGSALMLASQQGSVWKGAMMLLLYSVGLGIPFLLSALLIDRLKGTFRWIKKHYRVINMVSGLFLVLVGIFMATGLLGYLLSFLSF